MLTEMKVAQMEILSQISKGEFKSSKFSNIKKHSKLNKKKRRNK